MSLLRLLLILLPLAAIQKPGRCNNADNFPGYNGSISTKDVLEVKPVQVFTTSLAANNFFDCNNSTFYMRLSSPGYKIVMQQTQTAVNGRSWIVGDLVNIAAGTSEGFIVQLDNSGSLLSQHILRINNTPVSIKDIRINTAGKLNITGILNGTNSVFISRLSTDLIPDWVETISFTNSPFRANVHLMEQDILALSIQTSSGINCFHVGATGSLAISIQLQSSGLLQSLGYANMVAGGNGLVSLHSRNGRYETQITSVSNAGGFVSNHILGNNSGEYKAVGMSSYSLRMALLAIRKNDNGSFTIERNVIYNSGSVETRHEYVVGGAYDFNSTGALTNAGDAFCISSPLAGKLLMVKHSRDYQTTVGFAREYNIPAGATVHAMSRTFDGGYIMGLNSADSSAFILMKTDSSGSLNGCGFQNLPIGSAETLNLTNSTAPVNFSVQNFTAVPASLAPVVVSLTGTFDCNSISCPPPAQPDTCQSTYYKTLISNSYYSTLSDVGLMRNNKLFCSSVKLDNLLEETVQRRGFQLYDESGRFIKGIYVDHTVAVGASYSRVKKLSDSTVLFATLSYVGSDAFVSFRVFSDNLELLSNHTFKTPPGFRIYSSGVGIGDIHQDAEGNFYLCGSTASFFATPATVTVLKVSAAGVPLWLKTYNLTGDYYLGDIGMTSNASSLILLAEGGAVNGSVSARMDKQTGTMINMFRFPNSGNGSIVNRFIKWEQGRILYVGQNNSSSLVIGSFDSTAKPIKLKVFPGLFPSRATDLKNGKLYISTSSYTDHKSVLMATDTALNLLFAKKYNDYNSAGYAMAASDAGYIYTVGSHNYGQDYYFYAPFIKKFGRNGELGACSGVPVNFAGTDINLNTSPVFFAEQPLAALQTVPAFPLLILPDNFGAAIAEVVCSSPPTCNHIEVSGPSTVCQLFTEYTYRYTKNAGCDISADVEADGTRVQVVNITDTSIVVRFLQTGPAWIKALIKTGCSQFVDSILVNVQAGAGFNLGNDTAICHNNTLLLDAGPGFNSYIWQDGSAAQTFVVTQPGEYYITVTNGCGETISDTINISHVTLPAVFIGSDTSICKGNTLMLTAPAGFSGYQWESGSTIIGNSPQVQLTVNVAQPIRLTATTTEGCIASDTLDLQVKEAPPVNLGNDSSFCANQSLTLTVGTGYSTYQWSTGQTGNSINIQVPGNYWVAATAANGCVARDTMIVASVYPLPQLNLGADFGTCFNESKRLDAGNFSAYLWQDNSTARYFNASQVGTYHVRVTDQHQCTARDSVRLTTIFQLPVNFLQGRDSICSYEKISLVSIVPFREYLWSTGSSQSAITIGDAGRYTLSVTDINGCKGKDTMDIYAKECMLGIYIPNTFTPNNDGRNDVFRPLVFGVMESYSLQLYNRYGQLLFSADNPLAGWDGNWKGQSQSTGGYVWICRYKFEGQLPKQEKGTVLLIR